MMQDLYSSKKSKKIILRGLEPNNSHTSMQMVHPINSKVMARLNKDNHTYMTMGGSKLDKEK